MSNKKEIYRTNELSSRQLKTSNARLSIDGIDKKILKLLIWDARTSYREIARQSNLSTNTVIQRLRKLSENKIINGYSANLDAQKLGYGLTAVIELVSPKLMLRKAMIDITELSNVYAVYQTTGAIDAIIIAKFKDVDELQNFLRDLYIKFEIQRSETRIVLKTVKEDFRVIL